MNPNQRWFPSLIVGTVLMVALMILHGIGAVQSASLLDNVSPWMINAFSTLNNRAGNGSSESTAAVSCGAIRDFYISKGESLVSKSNELFFLFYLDVSN